MPITHMWVIENSITHMWDIGFLELSCMTSLWYNNVNVALVTRRYWKRYQLVVTNKALVANKKIIKTTTRALRALVVVFYYFILATCALLVTTR